VWFDQKINTSGMIIIQANSWAKLILSKYGGRFFFYFNIPKIGENFIFSFEMKLKKIFEVKNTSTTKYRRDISSAQPKR
jgi:hypothetical protein